MPAPSLSAGGAGGGGRVTWLRVGGVLAVCALGALFGLQHRLAAHVTTASHGGDAPAAAAAATAVKLEAELAALKQRAGSLSGLEAAVRRTPRASYYDVELDYDFEQTAIITMAAGNAAIRGAIALMQSLRDVGTRAGELVVLLSRGGEGSPECQNLAWKRARGREEVDCHGPDTTEDEIVSPQYIAVLRDVLGVVVKVVDMIPSTAWTADLAGGRSTFWGMALNKMQVFNVTQYRKIVWMDSDTLVFHNPDSLFKEPSFSTAVAVDCCNHNGPGVPAGGLWVVEPSLKWGEAFWRMMADGQPAYADSGSPIMRPDGTPERSGWIYGDQEILRWLVSVWNPKEGTVWPRVSDQRYGVVDGLRFIPEFANLTDAEFEERALFDRATGQKTVVGWRDASVPRDDEAGRPLEVPGMFGLSAPIWRPLSILWDVFVGNCECMPERDAPHAFHSVHFSCLQWFGKPGSFDSEAELMGHVNSTGLSCTRHYYLAWYDVYMRAAGRLPPPLWAGGPIPRVDAAHDVKVRAHQAALKTYYDGIENERIKAEMAEMAAVAAAEGATKKAAAAA